MARLWARLRLPGLMLVGAVAYGTVGFMVLEGYSFVDALYMTVITLSTVGFREVQPLDPGGKLFTMSLIVVGVAVALVTVSLVALWLAEADWLHWSRRRRMDRRIAEMTDHVIICAYGRVGRAVARALQAEGVPFVVIDQKAELEERLVADDVPHLMGDSSSDAVLQAARVERARGLVCAVDSDATNVYITLMARQLNPGIFIVARASESAAVDRLTKAGADRVISPYVSSGHHMALLVARPQVAEYVEVPGGPGPLLRLVELEVKAGSGAGETVRDVVGDRVAVSLRRQGGRFAHLPDGATRLQEGDLLVLLEEPPPS